MKLTPDSLLQFPKRVFALAFACILFAAVTYGAQQTVQTTCEFQTTPLAVNTPTPRFGWALAGSQSPQKAYEIDLKGENLSWNSGTVVSEQSQLVRYNGKALIPGQKYNWRVRITTTNGTVSPWSEWNEFRLAPDENSLNASWIGAIRADSARIPAGKRFSSALMNTPEYKALWKNTDSLSRKSILLRKAFTPASAISEATTYICGLGHYEFSINGHKVGDAEFAPFWSDYDKTVYYNTFDIKPYLLKGENVFGVLLGNGFFNAQGGRYSKLRVSFGPPTLFFKTIIRYTDNSVQEIVSGPDWKFDFSPITFNDIYGGEDYDARLEQKGWNLPGFDDSNWKKVVIQQAPKGVLTPQQDSPVKIMERFNIHSFKKLSTAECDSASRTTKRAIDHSAIVFDMYQNLSGYPEITVNGRKGDRITLIVGESVTPEGAVDQRQTGRLHSYNYTLKGNGDETWHPRFSYYGFHYIQVEGVVMKGDKNPRKLPVLKDLKSCFVYNSAPQVSTFECSNKIFTKAHVLIEKAIESNMQGVFTDCPQREKLAWIEQLHLNGPGLMYNYNLASFTPKIVQDMADGQQADGMIPTITPMYNIFGDKSGKFDNFGDSPEWGSSFLILPRMYQQFYGDSSLIVKNYPAMRRYIDYLASKADKHILSFGLGDWYDYGNFRAGFSRNTPVPFVATAYYYYDLKLMAHYAEMLHNDFDKAYYRNRAEEVRNAINAKFFNPKRKLYATGSQTALSMAVYMDIVNPEYRQDVLNNLIKDIHAHGNRLTTGDIGNRYLFQTLADNNLNELMYTMHNHEEAPGYGFQLKFGATTLTEQWDPRQGSSWNHFMMGQIDEWFFRSLAGMQSDPEHPGMQQFIIHPEFVGDLTFVRASTQSLYGRIAVEWKRNANNVDIKVEIPWNCTAKLYLPGAIDAKVVSAGIHQFKGTIK